MQEKLLQLKTALAALCDRCYHYQAADQTGPNYIVWMEEGLKTLEGDNAHAEDAWEGSIDVYTRIEFDELLDKVPEALEEIGASWSLNSVQFEESRVIHYEWLFSLA